VSSPLPEPLKKRISHCTSFKNNQKQDINGEKQQKQPKFKENILKPKKYGTPGQLHRHFFIKANKNRMT
jgi:hypothetical protein